MNQPDDDTTWTHTSPDAEPVTVPSIGYLAQLHHDYVLPRAETDMWRRLRASTIEQALRTNEEAFRPRAEDLVIRDRLGLPNLRSTSFVMMPSQPLEELVEELAEKIREMLDGRRDGDQGRVDTNGS